MNNTLDPRDTLKIERASLIFGAYHRLEQLTSEDPSESERVTFKTIFQYMYKKELSPELESILEKNASLRKDYKRLIEKHMTTIIPLGIAADTGAEVVREGLGCRIKFVPSSAEPSQTYVIIEFTEDVSSSEPILFICDEFDKCTKIVLEASHNGKVQLLLENDSELLSRLRDKKTVVFRRS